MHPIGSSAARSPVPCVRLGDAMVESVADTTMTQRIDESAWPGQPPSRGEGAGTDASRAEPGRRSCLSDPARGARQGATARDEGGTARL